MSAPTGGNQGTGTGAGNTGGGNANTNQNLPGNAPNTYPSRGHALREIRVPDNASRRAQNATIPIVQQFEALERNAFTYPPEQFFPDWLPTYHRSRWDFIERLADTDRRASAPPPIVHGPINGGVRPNPLENDISGASEPLVDGKFQNLIELRRRQEANRFHLQGIGPQRPDGYIIEQMHLLRDRVHLFLSGRLWNMTQNVPPLVVGANPDLDSLLASVSTQQSFAEAFATLDGRRHLAHGVLGELLRRSLFGGRSHVQPQLQHAMDAFMTSITNSGTEREKHRWLAMTRHLAIHHSAVLEGQPRHIGHASTRHRMVQVEEGAYVQACVTRAQLALNPFHIGHHPIRDGIWEGRMLRGILTIGQRIACLLSLQLNNFTFIGMDLSQPDPPPPENPPPSPPRNLRPSNGLGGTTIVPSPGPILENGTGMLQFPMEQPNSESGGLTARSADNVPAIVSSTLPHFERPAYILRQKTFDPEFMEEIHTFPDQGPETGAPVNFYLFPGLTKQEWNEATGGAMRPHCLVKISVCCCNRASLPAAGQVLWTTRNQPVGKLVEMPLDPVPRFRAFAVNSGNQANARLDV